MSTANAFWTDAMFSNGAMLPSYAILGLRSAVQRFDTVLLWSYGHIVNVPSGINIVDASAYLPIETAQALRDKNVPLAHISDIVRFRAAANGNGASYIIDVDNVWLRRPPEDPYVFSTLFAKRTGGVAPSSAKWKTMAMAFAHHGWDGGDHINTPLAFTGRTPFALGLLEAVEVFITKTLQGSVWPSPPKKHQWNTFMWKLADLIVAHNLGTYTHPPVAFGPLPFWKSHADTLLDPTFFHGDDASRTKFGTLLPSAETIMSNSYCVPTSFALARAHQGLDVESHAEACPTSLLAHLVHAVNSEDGA